MSQPDACDFRTSAQTVSGTASCSGRLFSFGVISDIQYADIENGFSFKKIPRYYRAALPALQRAVQAWKDEDVNFGIHFGDIIDGYHPKDQSMAALDAITASFDELGKPHWHMIGNHCLYNLPREVLNARLNMGGPGGASYYSFTPHPAWQIVVLDGYDVSLLGWPQDHPLHQQACRILDERNPNQEKNSPEGMEGLERRFVKFGGGASDAQLGWLRQTLAAAAAEGQRVILCCHLALHPDTCPGACLLWNYQDVLQACWQAGNVVATFSGHAHEDGYAVDEHGVHHRVLSAVVETAPGRDCFGIISVFPDRLELQGYDRLASATMHFLARQKRADKENVEQPQLACSFASQPRVLMA
ncbi:g9916 [Coccomyxa elongata]